MLENSNRKKKMFATKQHIIIDDVDLYSPFYREWKLLFFSQKMREQNLFSSSLLRMPAMLSWHSIGRHIFFFIFLFWPLSRTELYRTLCSSANSGDLKYASRGVRKCLCEDGTACFPVCRNDKVWHRRCSNLADETERKTEQTSSCLLLLF